MSYCTSLQTHTAEWVVTGRDMVESQNAIDDGVAMEDKDPGGCILWTVVHLPGCSTFRSVDDTADEMRSTSLSPTQFYLRCWYGLRTCLCLARPCVRGAVQRLFLAMERAPATLLFMICVMVYPSSVQQQWWGQWTQPEALGYSKWRRPPWCQTAELSRLSRRR